MINMSNEIRILIREFIEDLENNWLEGKKKMIEKWKRRLELQTIEKNSFKKQKYLQKD